MPNHIHLLIELANYGYDNGMVVDKNGDIAIHDHNATGDGAVVDKIHDPVVVDKIHEFYLRSQTPLQPPLQSQPPQPPILQSTPSPTGQQIPDMVNDINNIGNCDVI
jgi:hypothetical protein